MYDEDIALVNRTERNNVVQGSRINFSLCREAMFAVASKYENSSKVVLIPSYTCQTVIDPFVQLGWTCYFYNIKKNLRIDTDDILQKSSKYNPSLLVVHPFHGMELLNEELDALRIIKRKGCILLEDVTQCIYEEKRPDVLITLLVVIESGLRFQMVVFLKQETWMACQFQVKKIILLFKNKLMRCFCEVIILKLVMKILKPFL